MIYFLGARPYDFTDDKTGKDVSGVTAWFCDDEQTNATGFIPFKASYSREKFAEIFGGEKKVNEIVFQPVAVEFSRYGKPESVSMIPEMPEG